VAALFALGCAACRSSASRSESDVRDAQEPPQSSSSEGAIARSADAKPSADDAASSAASSAQSSSSAHSSNAPQPSPSDAAPNDAASSHAATDDAHPLPGSAVAREANSPAQSGGSSEAQTPANAASSSPSSPATATTNASTSATDAFPIHGSVATRYRGRWTEGEHDHDLYATGSLSLGDPTRNAWTGYVLGEGALDLDGRSPAGGQSTFFSLQDTYDGALTGRLYAAYVDYHESGWFDDLRLGRQSIYETPTVAWFDGLRADTRAISDLKLKFGAYGGVAVYPYETFDHQNAIGGVYSEMQPWKGAHARFDWMYLADDKMFGFSSANLIGLSLGQTFGPYFRFDGNGTLLDGKSRDYTLKASWNLPDEDLSLQASFYQLVQAQMALPLQIDPFFETLMTQFPYYQGRLMASKGFGDRVNLQGGFDIRRVTEQGDVGEFNRDFEHGFLTGTLSNTLPLALDLSVTGDLWYSTGDDITTWGVDLSRKFGARWGASIGSYFSLFKYDLFENHEHQDVRTYYATLRFKQAATVWDLRYEYEDDPGFGYFQTLRLGATWSF
jgi:hypothetical protein